MKIQFGKGPAAGGYALLIVMAAMAGLLLVLATTMTRTSSVVNVNDRNATYNIGLFAAEAAVEKIVGRMRTDYANGGLAYISNNLSLYQTSVPTTSEDPYWGKFYFTDGQGNPNMNYVQCISNQAYQLLSGPYTGLQGWSTVYRVLSNVVQTNGTYMMTNAVQEDVECDLVPLFQFAIFYNSLLEFTWAAPLTVRGPTHANNSIFLGSASSLTFNNFVSASGQMLLTNWAGHTLSQYTGTISFATNVNGGYSTNYPVLQLPIGTNNSPDAVREVVNMPPAGESVNSSMGQQRYYNNASMDLLISNQTVTAIIKNAPGDASPTSLVVTNYGTNSAALSATFPFLSVTNSFTDQRESKTVVASQINMGSLASWATTNSAVLTKRPTSNPFNILYVADNRTNVSSSVLYSVRLTNGTVLPTALDTNGSPTGFTVATPNPLYVMGNYNCTNAAYLNTTNTSATVPASLVADALTVLSPTWSDSLSSSSFTSRVASSTTINAAILAGVVYTSGSSGTSPFSGGVVNLPRLLEDWGNGGSVTLTINTSMVNLFNSVRATGAFQNPGVYYYAPTRSFNFDQNFLNQSRLPPGTPKVNYLYREKWTVPPPHNVAYYGN